MTELIWDGKYDKDGRRLAPLRLRLPFQTVETVNESAQQRQRTLDLFSAGREPDWRNRLIWGDKKYVLPALLEEFAGQVNLIYIDPPFNVGADFSFTATIPDDPDSDDETTASFTKQPSVIEQKAYRDTWGRGLDSYLQWFYETVVLLRELLAEDGSIYVHLDSNIGHYAKVILDEVFGRDNFDSEVIWKRKDAQSSADTYGLSHDTIYFYHKGKDFVFVKQYVPLSEETADTWYTNEEVVTEDTVNRKGQLLKKGTTRRYNKADASAPGLRLGTEAHYEWRGHLPPAGRHWAYRKNVMLQLEKEQRLVHSRSGRPYEKRYLDESSGIPAQSMWTDISFLRGMTKHQASTEWLDYPTQKPEALLERILKASSNENDLVLDCFCGSGTTAAVAEKLGRRWIACDLGRFAIHTTRKRLLGIENVRPFVVQNLGKYERQAWQAAEFRADDERQKTKDESMASPVVRPSSSVDPQTRYRTFILDLYNARPISGYSWLHGVKGGRMVHVGSVDAPVSAGDVSNIVSEFRRAVGTGEDAPTTNGIDILGWDFAFEINEVARQQAAAAHVQTRFVRIPRDVMDKRAVEQGDIRFFELAALAVEVKTAKRAIALALTDFVIPPDDVPADVQKAITHWSQWIDYWAVDWDNHSDAFHNEWQTYRTRKQPRLDLAANHIYDAPGRYTVVVKVIDILGNDTTKTLMVEVE
jgi:DNA modification methylase